MFLRVFLSFLIFFSLPTWVFAVSCERGFSNEEIFISFAKEQIGEGYKAKLGVNWSKEIAENTKHWTRTEVSQFLDFLISRIGGTNVLSKIHHISFGIMNVSFKDFMEMVRFYDQISKDVLDTLLYQMNEYVVDTKDNLPTFIRNYIVDKVKTQQLSEIIGSYFGGVGVAYIMGKLPIHEVNLNDMKSVMYFVNGYISKHGGITEDLGNRVNFFREVVGMEVTQKRPEIVFKNFDELREFGRVLIEEIRREETNNTSVIDLLDSLNRNVTFLLLEKKVNRVFYGLSNAKRHTLIKTVRILREYIEPAEIAKLMVNEPGIYLANPKRLVEVISILKQTYNFSNDKNALEDKNKIRALDKSQEDVSLLGQLFETRTLPVLSSKELIVFIIKENIGYLLLANPTYLKNTITILEKYLSKADVSFMLRYRTNQHIFFQRDLLEIAGSNGLQKIVTVLEKVFEKNEITEIVMRIFFKELKELFDFGYSFAELAEGDSLAISTKLTVNFFPRMWIEAPDQFVSVVDILRFYLDKRSVLFRRINELIEEVDVSSVADVYDALVRMSRAKGHEQMIKLLNSGVSLSEFSPKIQEMKAIENMMSKELGNLSNPDSLH